MSAKKHAARQALMDAADLGLLHYGQIDPLVRYLETHPIATAPSKFNCTTLLYYMGGALAVTACGLFGTLAVQKWGISTLLDMSLLYLMFTVTMSAWMDKRGLAIPAGIFASLTIALVPLVVFSLQQALGYWDGVVNVDHYRDMHRWIDARWLVIELATLAVSVLTLMLLRSSFFVLPIVAVLFYMGMDIVPAMLAQGGGTASWFVGEGWVLRHTISLVFGLSLLLFAFIVDVPAITAEGERDYAFWLYLSGLLTFWLALTDMGTGALSGKLAYLAINASLVVIGTLLARRMFVAFGGIGMALVLGNLSWSLFKDRFVFLALVSALGFVLIYFSIWWGKHEQQLRNGLRVWLPLSMQMRLVMRR